MGLYPNKKIEVAHLVKYIPDGFCHMLKVEKAIKAIVNPDLRIYCRLTRFRC